MDRKQPLKERYARLLIALAVAAAGLVSVSLGHLGKWTGVRAPLQVSQTIEPVAY